MTEQEFYQKVDGECHEDLIVFIRQKYKSEKEWEYTNQLYLAEGIGFVWQVDWHEGQENVEILGYIPVREVEPIKHAKQKYIEREVLDKIRAEIEQDAFKDVNGSKYIFVNRINQIIDKYKGESEKA